MEHEITQWNDIERAARESVSGLIFQSEEHFNEQVRRIANEVFKNTSVKILLVAGPSASGKTTFSKLLQKEFEKLGAKAHHIEMDDYFIDRNKLPILPSGLMDFDSPAAVDLAKLKNDLRSILKGRAVTLPKFDFISGTRVKGDTVVEMTGNDVLIIEGIHAHYPQWLDDDKILAVCKKIFIAPMRAIRFSDDIVLSPSKIRLMRRIIRDLKSRGHTVESTLRQWNEVNAAENKYIFPYMKRADYLVDSLYDYELFVYKNVISTPIASVKDERIYKIKECLSYVDNVPISKIPETSLINEFIG